MATTKLDANSALSKIYTQIEKLATAKNSLSNIAKWFSPGKSATVYSAIELMIIKMKGHS
jgi:hypothetical protein